VSKSSRRRARAKARKQISRHQAAPAASRPIPSRAGRPPRRTTAAPAASAAPGRADAIHAAVWPTGLLNVTAIAGRELGAVFVSPVGWVVAAVFTFLVSGFGFIGTVLAGQQATMDGVFGVITGFLILILIPVVTMRLLAEERSQGTLELLLTSPVRDWELAVGKWLGAFVFYVLLIATTLVYVVVLAVYIPDKGALDFGLIAATYAGMLLVGAAAIAIGVLASSLTRNQIIAYLLSLGVLLVTWYSAFLLGFFIRPPLNLFFDYVSGYSRYQSFSLGQVTLRDALYFATVTVGALFLTTRWLDSRQWR